MNITFINPNTEEQIVHALAGVLAYNIKENNEKIKFEYNDSNSFQDFYYDKEDKLKL